MGLLASAKSARTPPERYVEAKCCAAALPSGDYSLGAERTRGAVLSHRDCRCGALTAPAAMEPVISRMGYCALPARLGFRPSRTTIRCPLSRDIVFGHCAQ